MKRHECLVLQDSEQPQRLRDCRSLLHFSNASLGIPALALPGVPLAVAYTRKASRCMLVYPRSSTIPSFFMARSIHGMKHFLVSVPIVFLFWNVLQNRTDRGNETQSMFLEMSDRFCKAVRRHRCSMLWSVTFVHPRKQKNLYLVYRDWLVIVVSPPDSNIGRTWA